MSKVKHTSGPWHRNIKPAKKYTTIFSGRNIHVAHLSTSGLTDAEIEANCDLITAAPDLLEALQALVAMPSGQYSADGDFDAVYEAALAAIEKATGEAQ